jgi:hypothetical protein
VRISAIRTGKDKGGREMEASSSARATLAPAQVTPRAPEARESQRHVAFLLLAGVLLLYGAVGFGLYEFFTFVF